MSYYQNVPIKAWALEDRPREKLLHRGLASLTDAELIAVMLGSGTRACSALDLARKLLENFENLQDLSKADVPSLIQTKGIGKAKAVSLVAAFELGRRKTLSSRSDVRVNCSQSVADYIGPRLSDLDQEVFYVLFLNRNHEIKAEKRLFTGGVAATIIDIRIVFKEAIQQLASSIILVHNHPSGNLQPSQADIDITQKLQEVGKIFDIPVLDHLIVSTKGYHSFADEGLL